MLILAIFGNATVEIIKRISGIDLQQHIVFQDGEVILFSLHENKYAVAEGAFSAFLGLRRYAVYKIFEGTDASPPARPKAMQRSIYVFITLLCLSTDAE